jgi:hypothetical protein
MFDWRLILEICCPLIPGDERDAVMDGMDSIVAGFPVSTLSWVRNQMRTASVTLFRTASASARPAQIQLGTSTVLLRMALPLAPGPGTNTSTARG